MTGVGSLGYNPPMSDIGRGVGEAIRKVFDHIDRIDPDELLKA